MKSFTFALLTMVFWGFAPVLAKIGLIKTDPFIGLALRTFVISGIILLYGILTGKLGGLVHLDFRSTVFLAGEGIFPSLLGHLAYYHALKLGEASRIVPIVAAFPLVTVAVALLFLGEKLSWYKLVGPFLIIAGILLIKNDISPFVFTIYSQDASYTEENTPEFPEFPITLSQMSVVCKETLVVKKNYPSSSKQVGNIK